MSLSSEALRLNEDIHALREARRLLDTVDPRNICINYALGATIMQRTNKILRLHENFAAHKLRKDHLYGPATPAPTPAPIGDAWDW